MYRKSQLATAGSQHSEPKEPPLTTLKRPRWRTTVVIGVHRQIAGLFDSILSPEPKAKAVAGAPNTVDHGRPFA
jgi:hypothetical protein